MLREIVYSDYGGLMSLYLHLHETDIPPFSETRHIWEHILADENYHIVVAEEDGRIVSSCTCVIVPNLTRGGRPYARVENVVTHAEYRGRGLATACLDYAKELAVKAGCYNIALLTSSKNENTLKFYENAGYKPNEKTGFVQWL
ncbi:MAG: GNAT family N-acetyltransferase [Oscillospiraceae bacterium]|nr:GNAT family N-acetyltransferase [Oscillospiraceae bacterium]